MAATVKGPSSIRVELITAGAVGALHTAIIFGFFRGQHIQGDVCFLAGLLGRQVLKTGTAGGDSSGARRTLNPLFVETLMGWPTGWTAFGSAATAWSLWLPRMRGELSRLGSTMPREAA